MFFSNLGPGKYRFRVIAANDNGVWNREGATLEFTIPPTFVQSNAFKVMCASVIGLLLWIVPIEGLGRPGSITGLILATGLGRYGLTLGPYVGRLAAQLALKEPTSFDPSSFNPDRPGIWV